MEVMVCPVKKLYQIAAEADLQECAAVLISSYEVEESRLLGLPSYVVLHFDDIIDAAHPHAFSAPLALRIKAFTDRLPLGLDTLFVCCDGGESRSAAVAAGLMRCYGFDEMTVWKNPRLHPNPYVYGVMCEAGGAPVTPSEVEERRELNRRAFREAF